MAADYALGFETLDEEVSGVALDVEGAVPEWLSGTLLRNGPGKFEAGGESFDHWFDGLAMLRAFRFDEGVSYTNRFLRTDTYRTAREEGALDAAQFGTTPDAGFLGRLWNRVSPPEPTDNACVNVLRADGTYLALTETPRRVAFDPDTLETNGEFDYRDGLEGHLVTAHPHRDEELGETVNVLTRFGRRSEYRVVRAPDGADGRELVATVETDRPAYVHSFGLTERRVVLVECPLVTHPLKLVLGGGSFIDRYDWRPERGARIHVVDRASGDCATRETDAFFCFHHVNAFDDGERVVVDLCAYPDADVVGSLTLDALRGEEYEAAAGEFRRYRVGEGVTWETLSEGGFELPDVAPGVRRRPYRYAYGQGTDQPATAFPTRLAKVDVDRETVETWESETYVGEPVFVPEPGGEREDDGALLAVGLDPDAERSVLFVVDAATMTERARAPLPHHLPFDFHGRFYARATNRNRR